MDVVPDRHCAPLAMQRLLKQQASPAHSPPVQHASPTCPQRAQIASVAADEQTVPFSHWAAPVQHVTPCLPQAPQKPERQARPCWQLDPQQAWPRAPHVEHLPPLHVPPGAAVVPQVAPSATHAPEKQHAPCEQLPSAQHGAPGAPHAAQVAVVGEQTNPGCRHVAAAVPTAGQHESPAFCPQAVQVPLTQRVPGAVHSEAVEPMFGG
jgi:hypothetical protein